VGVPESKLVLGKHSGRHALHKRAEDLGFDLSKEELNVLYERFTTMADRKKGVGNEEIIALIHQLVGQVDNVPPIVKSAVT
jgi:2-isopropylmalate synthase